MKSQNNKSKLIKLLDELEMAKKLQLALVTHQLLKMINEALEDESKAQGLTVEEIIDNEPNPILHQRIYEAVYYTCLLYTSPSPRDS